jgi:diaminopimelate epimerase
MVPLAFTKMHGLGNDFVVIDARAQPFALSAEQARTLADRQTGVGCDQVIIVEKPGSPRADAFMRIRNADGGEVGACGNATRCVAAMLMRETGRDEARVETTAGVLEAHAAGNGMIRVDMGEVRFDWKSIPLARPVDTLHLGIGAGALRDPVAVNVGNPHAVFFVEDLAAVNLEEAGPMIEHHALFPQRTNVEAAQVLARDRVRLKVWERGVGVTRACGTGACATVATGVRRGLLDRAAEVVLDGGALWITYLENGHVAMTGPIAVSFTGTVDRSLLRA